MDPVDADVTRLLGRIREGDDAAREDLFKILYDTLRRTAGSLMQGQAPGHTLQATALVSEVYLRISGAGAISAGSDRSHFLAIAARGMRQVLIDHARRKQTRRKVLGESLALDSVVVAYEHQTIDLIRLDETLSRLAEADPEMSRAVEIRFFAGAGIAEVAEMLNIPLRTFERRWESVRKWIYDQLDDK